MITEKMIVDEVRKVICENPDYVYKRDRCSYLECNEACVFGVVLSNLGLSQDDIKKFEKVDDAGNCNFSAGISLVLSGVYSKDTFGEISGDVRQWCQKIQIRQDEKNPWKECLRIADERYPQILEMYPI